MSSIDERIVAMRFDNQQFEKGVKESTATVDGLKKTLNLDGTKKSLEGLSEAGRTFSLAGMASGIETIASKFGSLAVVGITALANITNKAVDAGIQIAKSLTLDPIKAGFAEYELKMGSIQTILANTSRYGTTLGDVTANLDALNDYADKTIYNFGDMTKNIGLFTNAGIRIEDATSMIKGFSNAAAASGTSAEGASHAAQQLSQAISGGTIRAQDWVSLTTVGMGNKNMQDGLYDIALAMGTVTAGTEEATAIQTNFKGSLESGWLEADVMSSYLKIMAGDMDDAAMSAMGLSAEQIEGFKAAQKTAEEAATKVRTFTQLTGTMKEAVGSGWSETFGIIIGDFDEATEMWTGVNNVFGEIISSQAEARNAMLEEWKFFGGRDIAIDAITTAFQALMAVIQPIKEAFQEIFPPMTGVMLVTITDKIRDFAHTLTPTQETLDNLKRTFKGIFAVLDIGWMIVKEVFGLFARLFSKVGEGSGGFLAFTGNLGDFLVKVRDVIKNGDILGKIFDWIGDMLIKPIEMFQKLGGFIGDLVNVNSFREAWEKLGKAFKAVGEFFKPIGDFLVDTFNKVKDALARMFEGRDFNAMAGVLNAGLLITLGVAIKKFFDKIPGLFSKDAGAGLLTSIKDSIKGTIESVFGTLTDTMKEMQTNLKADTLMKIAIAIGILTAAVIGLSFVDTGKLFIVLGAMTVMFGQLVGAMKLMDKAISNKELLKISVVSGAMIALATAMVILSAAVLIMSTMEWDELARGLVGLGGALAIVALMANLLPKNLILTAPGLVIAAVGIAILAGALKLMALLSWDEIGRSMTALGSSLAILAVGLALMSGSIVGAASLIIASVAIIALAAALKLLSMLSWDDIGRVMTTLGGSLAILAVGLTLMVATIPGSAALAIASVALIALAYAFKILSDLSWDDIGRIMTTLGGALGILAVGLTLMLIALPGASALVVASAAMLVLGAALKKMAKLSWDEIGRAMVALGGSLAILAVGLTLMIAAMPGAAALVVASAALTILATVLKTLGEMKWEEIALGLGTISALLTIIAIAGVLLIPALPGLFGLGAAALLIGAGALLAGLGLAAMAGGIALLAAVGPAGAKAIEDILLVIVGMIPKMMAAFAQGLIDFAIVITKGQEEFTKAFSALILSFVTAVNQNMPLIIDTVFGMMRMILMKIDSHMPFFVDVGMSIIINFINGISAKIPQLVTVATVMIIRFINAISASNLLIIQAAGNAVLAFINGLTYYIDANSWQFIEAGRRLFRAVVNGVSRAIETGGGELAWAGARIGSAILKGAMAALGIKSPSKEFEKVGTYAIQGLTKGLDSQVIAVTRAGEDVGEAAIYGLQKSISGIADAVAVDMNLSPTITPVLDLSLVRKDSSLIGGMLEAKPLPLTGAYMSASTIATGTRTGETVSVEEMKPEKSAVTFIQNNTSPKALSAAEIYRQTKNQLSIAKGALTP